MSSRNILIIVIAAVLLILIVGLYFLLFAPKSVPPAGTQTGQTGALPNVGNQSNLAAASSSNSAASVKSFDLALNQPVLDYAVSTSGVITAIEPNGNIIQTANGQISTISSLALTNIINAEFSYDGAKILVNFGDPQNPQTSIFDIASKAWLPMAQEMTSPAWSPSDYRIAYRMDHANGTEAIAIIDASKKKPAPITLVTLHAQDLAVAWASKTQITISTKPSAYVPGSEWLFDLKKNALTSITTEVPGLEILWNKTLVSSAPMGLEFSSGASNLGGSIMLTDSTGNIEQRLKFLTLPTKCAFAATSDAKAASTTSATTTTTPYLYCGVPRDQNALSFAHLPDDYDQMALFTSDDLYGIDLQTGAIDTISNNLSQNLDTSDVKLVNGTLFLLNRLDGKIYSIVP